MMEKILSALEDLGIHTWLVQKTVTESTECFFIRKRLDLKRRADYTSYTVSVYRPFEKEGAKLLGVCDVPVYPGMGEEELRQALSGAFHAASFAGNPFYELPHGAKEPHVPAKSGFAAASPEENLRVMIEALFAADTHEDVFLNSAELFAVRKRCHVRSSEGVDVSWDTCKVEGEYVVQCVTPNDVETYHQFSYREPDAAALRADVENALTQTRDRAAAVEPPKAGRYTVLLSAEHMPELFSYYLSRSGSGMVHQHYSNWAVGDSVQGEDVEGDRLTITLKAAEPYDEVGFPLVDCPLMEDGVLKTIHGSFRFAYYLGIQPTGLYDCIEVPTGSTPLEELKKRPYLHIVSFSDFQMDTFSGHFGGEVRLAYLYDGQTVRTVTGGSVNGSILEAQKHMVFSKERYRSSTYDGPFAVAIEDVAIAGIE